MWTCPKCSKKFKNPRQEHSCGNFTVEQVFEKRPAKIYHIFKIIDARVKTFGNIQIRPVKNGVMYAVKTTFLALKPQTKYLGVEFTCGNAYDEFPVEKCVKISKIEYAHIMKVETTDDIDDQLWKWLKESYQFNSRKK